MSGSYSLPCHQTASGPDGISSQILKISASSVAPQLSALFNLSLSSGSVPTDWKLSNITAVYKVGDPSLVSNYRPISLLSLPSKILERIVHNKLLDYLLSNSLLSRSQFGFRPSSSTQEALISATTDWHKLLDSKANVAAVFFDLSKVFDSIPHSGILNALSGVSISGSLHQWFASYLSNPRQCVVLDGCSSTSADVSSGVPQGSILGPLLFILYMYSITLVQLPVSPDTKILLYADDILLYSPIYQSSDILIFQSDVDSISQWVSQSGLRLNAAKTKLVLFSRKRHPPPITLSIDGTPIPQVNSIKYLGVILSHDLSWARHIDSVCMTAKHHVGFLYIGSFILQVLHVSPSSTSLWLSPFWTTVHACGIPTTLFTLTRWNLSRSLPLKSFSVIGILVTTTE